MVLALCRKQAKCGSEDVRMADIKKNAVVAAENMEIARAVLAETGGGDHFWLAALEQAQAAVAKADASHARAREALRAAEQQHKTAERNIARLAKCKADTVDALTAAEKRAAETRAASEAADTKAAAKAASLAAAAASLVGPRTELNEAQNEVLQCEVLARSSVA